MSRNMICIIQIWFYILQILIVAAYSDFSSRYYSVIKADRVIYKHVTGVRFKLKCASYCNVEEDRCVGYLYNSINKTCQLADWYQADNNFDSLWVSKTEGM